MSMIERHSKAMNRYLNNEISIEQLEVVLLEDFNNYAKSHSEFMKDQPKSVEKKLSGGIGENPKNIIMGFGLIDKNKLDVIRNDKKLLNLFQRYLINMNGVRLNELKEIISMMDFQNKYVERILNERVILNELEYSSWHTRLYKMDILNLMNLSIIHGQTYNCMVDLINNKKYKDIHLDTSSIIELGNIYKETLEDASRELSKELLRLEFNRK